ncbi:MAG: TatD family hydrolase [Gammaproteobacteria bacterium]|nr:TatD family hydrolase [Gammaproteobacteria bacterium]
MWIDTHTHFDASVFDETRSSDWKKARSLGVSAQFVMSIAPFNFSSVEALAHHYDNTFFALGIHPMYVMPLNFGHALSELKSEIERNINNPRFIGIGEIGLDGFIEDTDWDIQVDFFTAQLKLAQKYNLPVFMHVRKSQDKVLKYCRDYSINKGIAHAFNGSQQQAQNYIQQGFKLGFGGAITYDRAKNLHRLIRSLPLDSIVLETDSPDMSPSWAYKQTNYSYNLPRIAEKIAQLRDQPLKIIANQQYKNIQSILPNFPYSGTQLN